MELCIDLHNKNVAHILEILYGNFRLYSMNGSICLRKYKTNNINKLFISFLLCACAPDFITSYHASLLSETRGKHAVGVI